MVNPSDLMQPPDAETLKKMLKDLGEDPQRLEKQLELFKEWLKCENYLPTNVDERMIINFIRHCKCDLEKAKKKFLNYLNLRDRLKHFYDNNEMIPYFDQLDLHKQIIICPKLTSEGHRVGVFRVLEDINQFDFIRMFQFYLIFLDFVLLENVCGGYIGIYDLKYLTARHLGKLNFKLLAEALTISYNAGPFRIKALHVVNAPNIPDTLAALLKKVIPQKIVNRVYVHKDTSTLKDYLPINIIPKEYGGEGVETEEACENLKSFFVQNRDWEQKVVDMKLRGPIPNQKREIYSFEDHEMGGSFRKLAID